MIVQYSKRTDDVSLCFRRGVKLDERNFRLFKNKEGVASYNIDSLKFSTNIIRM